MGLKHRCFLKDTADSDLQPGLGALGYRFRPAEPCPLSDVQDRPLVLAMRLGWVGAGWKAQRRSSQSSWDNRPCTDGTIKEQHPAGEMEACSGNLESLRMEALGGQEGSQAGWVSGHPTPAPAQGPPAVGDDGNTDLAGW